MLSSRPPMTYTTSAPYPPMMTAPALTAMSGTVPRQNAPNLTLTAWPGPCGWDGSTLAPSHTNTSVNVNRVTMLTLNPAPCVTYPTRTPPQHGIGTTTAAPTHYVLTSFPSSAVATPHTAPVPTSLSAPAAFTVARVVRATNGAAETYPGPHLTTTLVQPTLVLPSISVLPAPNRATAIPSMTVAPRENNGTQYQLGALYEGYVKRYNPVRGFGFLTATFQLVPRSASVGQGALADTHRGDAGTDTDAAVTDDASGSQPGQVRYFSSIPVVLGDIFVHQSNLVMRGFRSLPLSARVRFRAEPMMDKDALQAIEVELLPQFVPEDVRRDLCLLQQQKGQLPESGAPQVTGVRPCDAVDDAHESALQPMAIAPRSGLPIAAADRSPTGPLTLAFNEKQLLDCGLYGSLLDDDDDDPRSEGVLQEMDDLVLSQDSRYRGEHSGSSFDMPALDSEDGRVRGGSDFHGSTHHMFPYTASRDVLQD